MWATIISTILSLLGKIVGPLTFYKLGKRQAKLENLEESHEKLKENAKIAGRRRSINDILERLRNNGFGH